VKQRGWTFDFWLYAWARWCPLYFFLKQIMNIPSAKHWGNKTFVWPIEFILSIIITKYIKSFYYFSYICVWILHWKGLHCKDLQYKCNHCTLILILCTLWSHIRYFDQYIRWMPALIKNHIQLRISYFIN